MTSAKGERLGITGDQPMTAGTISVQGLTPEAAVEILQRKIQRARRANADTIKVLYLKESPKVLKKLQAFLEQAEGISAFNADEKTPGVLWVHFA